MSTPLGSMHIELGLDTSKFASNLNASKRAVQYFSKEAQALDSALKNNGNNLTILSAKQRSLSSAFEKQSDVLKTLKANFDKLEPGTKQWERAAIEIEQNNIKLESLRGQLQKVENQIKDFGKVEAFKKISRDVETLESRIDVLDTAIANGGNKFSFMKEKSNLLKQAFEKQKIIVDELRHSMDQMDPKSDEWAEASLKVDQHTKKLINLQSELAKTNGFSWFGQAATSAGEKLRAIGNAMAPVSTALSAGFALSTRKALDFEGQMQTTKALLSDTAGSAGELNTATNQLSESSKKWAKQFGISTTDINTGMQEIIKAGLDANQTMGAMPSILTASKATGEDFNTVMGATTSIMSQFGLITSDTTQMLKNTNRVTDSLSFVANKTKAGFSDMGLAMEYVGPVANSVGMSIEETAAAIGILSNAGIDGQKAGTALRGALSKLLDPSKENAAAFEKLGFSAEEFRSGAIKLPDVIDRIRKNTEGMTDAQKAALIAQAFGIEAQSGINALVNEGADSLRNLTTETQNAEGYTDSLYKKMSSSGKASVERFKSSLEVLQVTIGQKLLPVLTPIIEKITSWVEKFAEADESTQRFWMVLAGGAAVAYPALNFMGNLSTGIGALSSGLGKLVAKRAAATTLVELGTAASGASGGIGALASSGGLLGALFSPTGLLIAGGVLAAGALAYFGQKALEAHQRTQEWGTKISETEAKELSQFKSKVDATNRAMLDFGAGAGEVKKVTAAFDDLAGSVAKLADEKLSKDIDMAKKLGLSETVINALKTRSEQVVTNVNGMSEQVKDIYERHNGDMSQLTQAEKELVLRNQNEMIQAQLELMDFSAKEKKALTAVLNGELDQLNMKQLDKALNNTNTMLQEENKSYKEKKAELKEILASFGNDTSKLNEQELAAYKETKAALDTLESEHILKTQAYKEQRLNIQRERVEKLRSSGKDEQQIQVELAVITSQLAKEMGISYQEAAKLLGQSVDTSVEKLGILSNHTANASKEVAEANIQWDSLFTSNNPQESLKQLLSTAEGWNNFEIMVKNADVNPAGRAALAEMLVAGGEWQNMTIDQKMLVVNNQKALADIFDSKEMLAEWQALTPEQKKLLAENLTANPVMTAKEALNSVKQDKPADITAEDKTASARESANASVNAPKQNAPISMLGRDDTGPSVSQVNASVNSPRQMSPVSMLARNDAGPAVAQANQAVNSPHQNAPAAINATNNTWGGVHAAQGALNSVQDKTVTITSIFRSIKEFIGFEKGTNYHLGGPAVVNDQKGPLYKELVTLPTGESFIPQGRNVLIDLPRGSKVLTASRTKALMERLGTPRYANGVGIPVDSPFIKSLDNAERHLSQQVTVTQDNSDIVALLKAILTELKTSGQGRLAIDVSGKIAYSDQERETIIDAVMRALAQELQRKSQLRGVST